MRRDEVKKDYTVLQDGIKECGSACLASIIKYYGGNIPITKLVEMTNSTKKGTNFYYLAKAAHEIGLSTKGYKINDLKELSQVDLPCICQILKNNYYHFIVIYKIKDNIIHIMNPSIGMEKIKVDEFKKIYTGNILTLVPFKILPIYKENNYLNMIIKNIIKENKIIIIKVIILTIITAIFTCLYSFSFKIIIDSIFKINKLDLTIIFAILLLVLFIKIITNYLRKYAIICFDRIIDSSIMKNIIDKIIFLPYNYYKNKTTGEIISRINDLVYLKEVILKLITDVILNIILSIIVLFILFSLNKTITFYSLIIIAIYFLVFVIYKKNIKEMTNEIQEENAKTNSLLLESIDSYETIKGLNIENNIIAKLQSQYTKKIQKRNTLLQIINDNTFLKDLIENIGLLMIIKIASSMIMDGLMSVGTLITYYTLLFYLITPISYLLDFYKELYYVKNSIRRINNILNFKYEKLDTETGLLTNGQVCINNLSFSYVKEKIILNNINLNILSGAKVLIYGASGSGKSTLLKLIYRYYEIDDNKIMISNNDINKLALSDIRKNIVYISQNEFLYTDTIKNNIEISRKISNEELDKICHLTSVDSFVKKNPLAYNLMLEENATNLSGGERQRIILTRALLKKTKIILIDEGLNEIDAKLERKILKNIFEYFKSQTIIIVSHRLSNIDLYNQVIHIESGRALEVLNNNF